MSLKIISSYEDKPLQYFGGCRIDYVDALPNNPKAEILEVGCAQGNTGELALARGKCATYIGIELSSEVAQIANKKPVSYTH